MATGATTNTTLDDLGRSVQMPAVPQRIVSLCPSQTEFLFALGLGSRVVGATRYCIHPASQMAHVVRVGGTKKVHLRRLAELQPDFVLCQQEENTPELVAAVSALAPVYVTRVESVGDALGMMRRVGTLLGCTAAATDMADAAAAGFGSLRAGGGTALRVAYLIWKAPWMGVGSRTYIDSVLAHLGWVNVLAGAAGRYPAVTLPELAALQPDVLLLSSEPYRFTDADAAGLRAALPGVRVVPVDGEAFSWYGSRMLHALPYLAGLQRQLAH